MGRKIGFNLRAKIEAAFDQASRKVVELAIQTKTPVIVWENGRIVAIPGDQVKLPAQLKDGKTKSKKRKPGAKGR